ncbi:hypothetical protein PAXRUDRAFT_657139 [Paxillus rubicundulus Ve08.2h10]|uniref:Uncharacterized protein n=1 Tax=Paxillus rubicundulus Ve08.2h10 TaxID=930991 RepID=A0A0D0E3A5_9AGAM|nr:hypothetical protein PAXRUDRAFT_657139 [Paxillus rubicundulus Ve08.2h10]
MESYLSLMSWLVNSATSGELDHWPFWGRPHAVMDTATPQMGDYEIHAREFVGIRRDASTCNARHVGRRGSQQIRGYHTSRRRVCEKIPLTYRRPERAKTHETLTWQLAEQVIQETINGRCNVLDSGYHMVHVF